MSLSIIISLALAASASAIPQLRLPSPPAGLATPPQGARTCDISAAKLLLPVGQTALSTPTVSPSSVVLGVGVQNYTCSTGGTYTAAGAVADLYDLSCISKVPGAFRAVQDVAYVAWKLAPPCMKTPGHLVAGYPMLGSHFFITSGTGLSPVWDYRAISAKGNANAFVLAAKVANIPAPTGSKDVDWLELKSVSGDLATQSYRTDTRGGPPPTSASFFEPVGVMQLTDPMFLTVHARISSNLS